MLVLVGVFVAEPVFNRRDLGTHVEQRLEGEARFLDDGAARVGQAILRQVTDGQPGRLGDQAAVGLFQPRHHLQQRGLAGSVRTRETDAIAIVDLPADGVQEDAAAERFGERGELDHGVELPG